MSQGEQRCVDCGKPFTLSRRDEARFVERPKRCTECAATARVRASAGLSIHYCGLCADCGGPFNWRRGEREFFQARGWKAPKRCPSCRQARKTRYQAAEALQAGRRVDEAVLQLADAVQAFDAVRERLTPARRAE
jgi:hypothetical protein